MNAAVQPASRQGFLDDWAAAAEAANDPRVEPEGRLHANDDPPGDVALAEICARLAGWFPYSAWEDRLRAHGWGEAAIAWIAGVARVSIDGDGLFVLDPHGATRAVIAPVFQETGEGVIDLIALPLQGAGWWLHTGLGAVLGRPWPALDAEGRERPVRLYREPRGWLEAGGWKDGPWRACCLLRQDEETRRMLVQHADRLVCDDARHGEEIHAFLRRRPKGPRLPEVLIARRSRT